MDGPITSIDDVPHNVANREGSENYVALALQTQRIPKGKEKNSVLLIFLSASLRLQRDGKTVR